MTLPLAESRENAKALLLVLVAKLLAIGCLLVLGPEVHLSSANQDEKRHAPVAAGDDNANPGKNLVHVVGAGHQGEAIAVGNLAFGATSGAERGEVEMDHGVADFTKEVESDTSVVNKWFISTGCKRAGVIDGESAEQARESPVESAVLEDVPDRHGVGGELVDKHSLNLALNKVRNDHVERKPLCSRQWRVTTRINVGAGGQNSQMEEDRAEIFEDEDASPGDLGTCRYKH